MSLFPRNRPHGLASRRQQAGDFIVPGISQLPLMREVLGSAFGPFCRISRILHEQRLGEIRRYKAIQVEYDLIDQQGGRREVACRFLDPEGQLIARAQLEIELLS